jgi:hypothetical protein
MLSQALSAIDGIAVYPIIALIIFIPIFIVAAIWTIKLNREYINTMEQLPLLDEQTEERN